MSLMNAMTLAAHTQRSIWGGGIAKAILQVDDPNATNPVFVKFQFNPETIQVARQSPFLKVAHNGSHDTKASVGAVTQTESTMRFDVIFDTFEEPPGTSVYALYVEPLEAMLGVDDGKGAPPQLLFTYGNFARNNGGQQPTAISCTLQSLDASYTLFGEDGSPIRSKVGVSLAITRLPPAQAGQAKMDKAGETVGQLQVKRGDRLESLAQKHYGDPGAWRKIADANGIDNPMALAPGQKLLLPPF